MGLPKTLKKYKKSFRKIRVSTEFLVVIVLVILFSSVVSYFLSSSPDITLPNIVNSESSITNWYTLDKESQVITKLPVSIRVNNQCFNLTRVGVLSCLDNTQGVSPLVTSYRTEIDSLMRGQYFCREILPTNLAYCYEISGSKVLVVYNR